jgi:ABC-type Fe3+/spermidine/putrescine transport system ATPase subunit
VLTCAVAQPPSDQGHVLVVFRPESIRLEPSTTTAGPAANVLAGTIQSAHFLGDLVEYEVRVANRLLAAQMSSRSVLHPGSEVCLVVDPECCLVVSAQPEAVARAAEVLGTTARARSVASDPAVIQA